MIDVVKGAISLLGLLLIGVIFVSFFVKDKNDNYKEKNEKVLKFGFGIVILSVIIWILAESNPMIFGNMP